MSPVNSILRRSLSAIERRVADLGTLTLVASLLIAGARVVEGQLADSLPLTPTRTIRFTTNEGTWLDLDVSPDGRTIIFEMLGDLYTLPMSGGRATRLTSGMAYDAQPRFSRDGRKIVFVSDRGGDENLWIADADGSHLTPLTRGEKARYQSPAWTPDGRVLVSKGKQRGEGRDYDQRTYQL